MVGRFLLYCGPYDAGLVDTKGAFGTFLKTVFGLTAAKKIMPVFQVSRLYRSSITSQETIRHGLFQPETAIRFFRNQ